MSFDPSSSDFAAIASGLGVTAGGFADLFPAKRIAAQQELQDAAKDDIDAFFEKLESGEFDQQIDPALLQAFSMTRRKTDVTPQLSALATSLDAASRDPRLLASSIPGITGQYSQVMDDISRKDFEREFAGKQFEGTTRQNIAADNLQLRRDIFQDKLASDQLAYSTAQDNITALNEAKAQAIPNILSGLGQTTLGVISAFGKDGTKIPEYGMGGDVMSQIMGAQQEGEIPARQDLPGPEDHDKNPIDMIAPNGEKVGEATGGEIILNSEQTDKIEDAVEVIDETVKSGEKPTMDQLMALYEAVSKTLSQPQFQDSEESSEKDMMRQRMEMMMSGKQMA
tara:strand:- start:76 stop:1092 length:1017 start_codon:yes stop_codon:yes gene_type:complete